MEIVKIAQLNKTYGKGATKVDALKNINLSVEEGEFVAIIGPSGSGKSTLMHILGGVDAPSSGSVIIKNKDIAKLDEKKLALFRRRFIGFIFQQYNLVPVLTVEENISLPLILDKKDVDSKQLGELLKSLGLEDRRHHLPSELSGGQQQRVAIGRALITKPAIILADEPTGNLDKKNGEEVLNLLKLSVKKYHQTLIMITHDPAIASKADRIINIEDGVVK
ncbi:MAG: ABC transporter ATP-binding protein [Clostridium beijerinckii]|nr:ABC transporter ATP-binding protein [Clostridium beijerinckii]MCI1581553.1 ABC transporter ATP-binding protein [Clostridium beijerinckii]MCI1585946.1 ABC transporter ATP-binding protein [Clostridium beijerinckii]MCI1625098.1 ABC transporter ATP-binding protein [Clostridium beijerinckii]